MKFNLTQLQVACSHPQPLESKHDLRHLTPAAVLILLYEKGGVHHLLFTQRTGKVSHHRHQISFPGGKYQAEDRDLEETALRETFEEVGVLPQDVRLLGQMKPMPTISNFLVTPFIGWIPYPYSFVVNSDEIEELIEVPCSHLLDKTNFEQDFRDYQGKLYPIYFYHFFHHTIWGITGQILYDFLTLIPT